MQRQSWTHFSYQDASEMEQAGYKFNQVCDSLNCILKRQVVSYSYEAYKL